VITSVSVIVVVTLGSDVEELLSVMLWSMRGSVVMLLLLSAGGITGIVEFESWACATMS